MQIFSSRSSSWRDRFVASGIHLSVSVIIACAAGLLVFGIWYPPLYREISGGRELFTLLITVDVILGPLLTFAIFNKTKPTKELKRDLAIIVALQIFALGYGLWTVWAARPVHMVFEYDRFRVVHAVDVPAELLNKTPKEVNALPLSGPTLLSLRKFTSDREKMETTLAALNGLSLSARPDLWQPYEYSIDAVTKASKPLSDLVRRFPEKTGDITQAVKEAGVPPETLLYLPLAGRKSFWTVILNASSAAPVAVLPIDSF
jgi:hypothetical protein